ncbi:spore germination protein GerPE [Virgibacillus sp. C22-A2]|uniref:Spore germination protein GerPE n=1 Tax=Virgibacillus tibetensis TaxID=3042313 RepID=A0ABU6KEA7_9BACI|nr:spore germination protein GerPE [Virgibacillus sp. C22-A2]
MQKRTAAVNNITANSIGFSSIFNIGDTAATNQKSRAIAVQQQGAVFHKAEEPQFDDYSLFKRRANWPKQASRATSATFHHSDVIHVNQVSLIGVSSSSVLQVGSINKIVTESRIKHFRKFRA